MPEEAEGPEGQENLHEPPSFFPSGEGEFAREPGAMGELIEVQIEGVFMAEANGQVSRFVLLSDGERKLPIMIGLFEAHAISVPLDGQRPDRPMTHDLMRALIEPLGGDVDRIVIDDLWNSVYYAKVYVRKDGEEIELDSRPSDAIAIAVRFDCPILVADGILDQSLEA